MPLVAIQPKAAQTPASAQIIPVCRRGGPAWP